MTTEAIFRETATRPGTLPSRARPRGAASIERLFDDTSRAGGRARGGIGRELARRYDGDLWIPLHEDRPTIVANFVETIDGVVAMDDHGLTGGGEVSGFSPTDRFVMGLLRALADVVLVGSATIRSSGRVSWTPAGVFPQAADLYAALRTELGLAVAPTTVIATASGNLDPALPVFAERRVSIVIAAPHEAARGLRRKRFASNVSVEEIDAEGPDDAQGLVDVARRLGARVVVSEAGPHLSASLFAAGVVDELFVTLAPQLAGRGDGASRLAMLEGRALWPGHPRWARLAAVRRAGDHLFLRYQFEEAT